MSSSRVPLEVAENNVAYRNHSLDAISTLIASLTDYFQVSVIMCVCTYLVGGGGGVPLDLPVHSSSSTQTTKQPS